VIGNQVQLMFPTAATVVQHLKSGRLRGLAVTSASPSPPVPGMPTMASAGLPGYESISMLGVLAPAKTPADIVRRLNAAVFDALKNAELRDAYTRQGNDITPGTPEAFAALIRSDTAKWARVIKSSGVKLDAP